MKIAASDEVRLVAAAAVVVVEGTVAVVAALLGWEGGQQT